MKVKKNWLLAIVLHYFLAIVAIVLKSNAFLSDMYSGLVYFVFLMPIVYLTVKENKLFSPISATIIFDISFSLYLARLVNAYESMEIEALLLVTTCSFIWKFTIITGNGFVNNIKVEKIETQQISQTSFTLLISILFIISVANMLFEWKMAGGIPALRADSETFRFTVSYSSITHLFAIMNKVVAALIGVYFVNKGYVSIRKDWILLTEMIIAEFMMIGTAMRGEMIMAPCIVFIVSAIKHKFPLKVYVAVVIAVLAFIGFMPYYRMTHSYGMSYIEGIKSISVYPEYYMFTPLYQSFTNNFDILNIDFKIFPELRQFGYGIYSILPEIPFVDLGASLMKVQNDVLNNDFYSGLTATYLASWYADFGNLGCIFVTFLYSKLVIFSYDKYLKEKSLFSLVWYAYTFYSSLWMFYNGTFNFVYLCYSIVMWGVLKIKFN